jgi:RNA polymerase sigma-70 factor (ECF subfamily)
MRAWLRTICRHNFISNYRRRRLHVSIDDIAEGLLGITPPTQEAGLEVERVSTALKELCPAQSRVLVLAGVHELSMQEIADQTGIPVGTVKTRLRKGRKALRSVSGNKGPQEEGRRNEGGLARRSAAIAQWRAAKATNTSMIIG